MGWRKKMDRRNKGGREGKAMEANNGERERMIGKLRKRTA